ncbi:hypothetical protein BDY24DRAFT_441954 [Mrakia frigida]|uniref:uncharacterized protein n=1 Tax=Mrakia frigida TaxID=29902 RepID=UPI003FCC1204
MIPPTPWVAPYRRGIEHLRACEYGEALKSLDKAKEHGRPGSSVLASELAFVEGEDYDASHDLELDSPRLFRILTKLSEGHRTLLLCPLSNSSPKVLTLSSQLVELETNFETLLSSRNLIDYLPPEVLSLIGFQAANPYGVHGVLKFALPLLWISRRWRSIFLRDPLIWRKMQYVPPRRQAYHLKRLKFFLDRDKIRELHLHVDREDDAAQFSKLLRGRVASIEVLSFQNASPRGTVWSDLLDIFGSSPNLRSLEIVSHHSSLPTSTRLLPSIKHLYLKGFNSNTSLFPLLRNLPFLESCNLQGDVPFLLDPSVDNSMTLSLPNLRYLQINATRVLQRTGEATCQGYPIGSNVQFLLPNLQTLLFPGHNLHASSYKPYLFPSLHPKNTLNLTQLDLSHSVILEPSFLLHLPHLPNLLILSLAGTRKITNATVEALTLGSDGSGACLRPREVVLTETRASYSAIRRMVESRDGVGGVPVEALDPPLGLYRTRDSPRGGPHVLSEEETSMEWVETRFAGRTKVFSQPTMFGYHR